MREAREDSGWWSLLLSVLILTSLSLLRPVTQAICITVWFNHILIIVVTVVKGNCGVGLSEKLQKPQYHATRILLHANNEDDIDKLFQALGWRKLSH